MFRKEDYGDLLIARDRTLSCVRYPLFCKIDGDNTYDIENDVPFETMCEDIIRHDTSYAVLDALDLSYQGEIDLDDIVPYEDFDL